MTSTPVGSLSYPTALSSAEQRDIRDLALRVEEHDGAEPLNEPALLRLATSDCDLVHVLCHRGTPSDPADRTLAGYAQIELDDPTSAEILVGLDGNRNAVAHELIVAAELWATASPVLVWSRGTSPVEVAARARGYRPERVLLTMRRDLSTVPMRALRPPIGVRLRSFAPGRDDLAWLAVNAEAFASHPEQGAWTMQDLRERIEQPWFDPAGFILAESTDGQLLGYHWTKVHPPARAGEDPIAEVYVLGISPAAQGRGLGRLLLEAGLQYLANGPAGVVILYVEQENSTAVGLYGKDGFAIGRRDTQFRRPPGR